MSHTRMGERSEGQRCQEKAIKLTKSTYGAQSREVTSIKNNLASTFLEQGQWEEAEVLLVQVMETSLRVRGQDHPSTLSIMSNFASTFENQGRWK